MKEQNKATLGVTLMVAIAVAISAVVYVYVSSIVGEPLEKEFIVIEGRIIDIIPVYDNSGGLDYVHMCFDTGQVYRVKLYDDLVVNTNSTVIVELYHYPDSDYDMKYLGRIIVLNHGVK